MQKQPHCRRLRDVGKIPVSHSARTGSRSFVDEPEIVALSAEQ
jgi:hypothetical protein